MYVSLPTMDVMTLLSVSCQPDTSHWSRLERRFAEHSVAPVFISAPNLLPKYMIRCVLLLIQVAASVQSKLVSGHDVALSQLLVLSVCLFCREASYWRCSSLKRAIEETQLQLYRSANIVCHRHACLDSHER